MRDRYGSLASGTVRHPRLVCRIPAPLPPGISHTPARHPGPSPPDMRKLWIGAVWMAFAALASWLPATAGAEPVISLAGEWRLELDPNDEGSGKAWFSKDLGGSIRLPGSLATNQLGTPATGIRQQIWGGEFTDKPAWHPMLRHDYRGNAWYQTTVEIPPSWAGRSVELFLERVCWVSEAWLDGKSSGVIDTLSVPHRHVFGPVAPGSHRLTLRVDNRQLHDLGCNTHAYHEQSCTIYHGVVGRIELRATPLVSLGSSRVFADARGGVVEMRLTVSNATGKPGEALVSAVIRADGGDDVLVSETRPVTLEPGETQLTIPLKLPSAAVKPWSEFEQPLYQARVEVKSTAGTAVHDERFGFRDFKGEGARFTINGKPVLLRGEVNNAQFPLTGHPPMDKETWLKIFRLFKGFGLNHLRCHAWTPPHAAFAAADELGIYVQAELPNGEASVATDSPAGLEWRRREFDRILETYGSHPSFVMMSGGNEAKTPGIDLLKELAQHGQKTDPRRLYATISNPEASGIKDEVPGDDFAVAHGSANGRRRMEPYFNRDAPETMGDYRATMAGRPVPQISHETGQWYVYPDLSEIDQYTGALRPVTLEHFRDLAKQEGVLSQVPDFVSATGRLSFELYKEEIERSLRTPEYGGFQLLGLQDSFDQGAAYVGMVNGFFKPKPFVTAEAFREFCGPQVPLARMPRRVWTHDETFTAGIEFANYGPAALANATLAWRVTDGAKVLAQGSLPAVNLPNNGLTRVGDVALPLSSIRTARKLQLEVGLRGGASRNRWNFWVYPNDTPGADAADGVLVVSTLDAAAQQALRDGRNVVLFPSGFNSPYGTAMTPPFWSPIMFSNQKQTLGLLCDPNHPALKHFPTGFHSDWQWFELLFQASAIRLNGTAENYLPIVQAIDRPDRNHKLALIYETKVGKGKLLVCTLDLNRDLEKRPVARQLRLSLLNYAASRDFNPASEIPLDGNLPAFSRESTLARLAPKMSASTEHENFWAIHAADNNPDTYWHSNWNPPEPALPHSLVIELKQAVTATGFIHTPRKDCDHGRIARYRIHAGDDGKTWKPVAEGAWENTDRSQTVRLASPVTARFFKLEALEEVRSRNWTSVAEFDVITR
jgi:F5/8 type C domain/Glycosyl hydrolases family 2, sugar binding domain/Glycosyl hydrolases family 2, TIM barrel domain/Glycosyl hydrolases family 2